MDWKSKLKNVYLWVGIAGVALAAGGVDFNTMTDWKLLFGAIMSIFSNPVALVSAGAAVIGIIVNPNTKGLKD